MNGPRSARSTIHRHPERGRYDEALIRRILDEALFCHVGFVIEGQPFVVPTIHARIENHLYLHGARENRMLRHLAAGHPVCVTVTLLDGLVLARSASHHSMNYRSVVVLGAAAEVTEPSAKRHALNALVEHVVPGRTADARPPDDREVEATMVVRIPIDEASAKVRSGPPSDAPKDQGLGIWAGVIPISLVAGEPQRDSIGTGSGPPPPYVLGYRRPPDPS